MKNYDVLDLTKIILAIMVVAIHTQLLPMVLYPWLRLAVPLFFIISSFLLYSKINNVSNEEKRNILKHYVSRLLKFYLFWFVILLPVTIYVRREWFNNGMLIGILNLFIKPFWGSTFIASWYIVATIIGTVIVDKLSEKFSDKILIPLFIIIYIVCCWTSNYQYLFGDNSSVNNVLLYVEPHSSFLVSLIYILFGKIISDKKLNISKKKNTMLIIVSCILLYIEWFSIYKINGNYNKDCYLLLMPTAVLIFNYIKDINLTLKNSKILRQFSNFTYPFHASVARIVNTCLEFGLTNKLLSGIMNFGITLTICLVSFVIIKKLEKKIKVLKYSY